MFRHTDFSYEEVDIQVPAGSLREGETPEAAALREAGEETGLMGFKIVRKVGETEYDISPYRFDLRRRHVFHLELNESLCRVTDAGGAISTTGPGRTLTLC